MSYYLTLYWRLVGARWRGQMQYKLSFALLAIGSALHVLLDFLVVLVFFRQVPHLVGWSLFEVALLFGLGAIAFALADAFAVGFDAFHREIVQGTFDRALVRPLPAFFQIFASDWGVRRIGRIAQALVLLAVSTSSLGVVWTADKVLVLVLSVLSGTLIFFGLFVIGAASSFWTVQGNEAVNIFTHGGSFVTGYPIDIFEGWFRRLITLVVPLAFIAYYPALYLLDRPDTLGLPDWARLASPVAAGLVCLAARLVWGAGVRRYQSAGS